MFRLLIPASFALASVLMAFDAHAITRELRWTHPQPDLPILLVVVADGENLTEVLVEDPDANGVFTNPVVLPFGAEIQIQVQDQTGAVSELSNVQVYGDDCRDWDINGDGLIGFRDWLRFRTEFDEGTASTAEYELFRGFFGQRCE
ncbi:MAG: hypothetical protein VX681_12635 [Myxococcota bacterium]|nr:hypothetical protein [Myxococcota bacterium]